MVEKPKPADAPSDLAVVGRYLLSGSIFERLKKVGRGAGGEIQLTDGIAALLDDEPVYAYRFKGKRYDCGSKLGYLEATVEYALRHPELGERFAQYLEGLVAARKSARLSAPQYRIVVGAGPQRDGRLLDRVAHRVVPAARVDLQAHLVGILAAHALEPHARDGPCRDAPFDRRREPQRRRRRASRPDSADRRSPACRAASVGKKSLLSSRTSCQATPPSKRKLRSSRRPSSSNTGPTDRNLSGLK